MVGYPFISLPFTRSLLSSDVLCNSICFIIQVNKLYRKPKWVVISLKKKSTWKSQRAAELDIYKSYPWKNNMCAFPFWISFTKKDSGAADHRSIHGSQNYCHPNSSFLCLLVWWCTLVWKGLAFSRGIIPIQWLVEALLLKVSVFLSRDSLISPDSGPEDCMAVFNHLGSGTGKMLAQHK